MLLLVVQLLSPSSSSHRPGFSSTSLRSSREEGTSSSIIQPGTSNLSTGVRVDVIVIILSSLAHRCIVRSLLVGRVGERHTSLECPWLPYLYYTSNAPPLTHKSGSPSKKRERELVTSSYRQNKHITGCTIERARELTSRIKFFRMTLERTNEEALHSRSKLASGRARNRSFASPLESGERNLSGTKCDAIIDPFFSGAHIA